MKKKILTVALAAFLLAVMSVSFTLAYFTDTDAVTNTFTVGKVDIKLDEAKVEYNEETGKMDVVGTERVNGEQQYTLFPSTSFKKDPTITVQAESEESYVAAKVTVSATDLETLLPNGALSLILDGGVMFNEVTTDAAIEPVKNNDGSYTYYVFVTASKFAGNPVVLFETMTIPGEWDNAQMEDAKTMKIVVEAFATQKFGFDDCKTAITTAFAEEFKAVSGN